ncbi:hypothetical protein HFN89_05015 [Rhizobium laguerreae]|nr:hypothetical protein [Rhizobium laguerreae]
MNIYHPIRMDQIASLRTRREDQNAAALQNKMLELLTKKRVSTRQLAADTSHLEKQNEEEQFDLESSVPWRAIIDAEIREAKACFGERGRNIFDMTLVSSMFRNVDADDVVIEDTEVPFGAVYAHFGISAKLMIGDDRWIEGAYLREVNHGREAEVSIIFVCNHPEADITDVVPLGITYKRLTTAVSVSLPRTMSVGVAVKERGFSGDPAIIAQRAVLGDALRMAVNGLLYVNLPRADVEFDYPEAAPRELVSQAIKVNDTSKTRRARATLDALGYAKVNFCGRVIRAKHAAALAGMSQAGRAIAEPHWRRGHWRRVAVGVGRAGREWRLIEPTIVNASAGVPKRGKIHIVHPMPGPNG